MVHCPKCGASLPPQVRFCDKCGQEQPPASWQPGVPWQPSAPGQSGLSENVAACLSYSLGWLTGIIFFVIDRRPYVRFHAAQSMVTFIGLHIARGVLGFMFGVGWFFGGFPGRGYDHWGNFGLGITLLSLIGLLSFVLWIICMVKAYKGENFMLPIAGDIAVSLSQK
jgi:uncharacterized membrane protein